MSARLSVSLVALAFAGLGAGQSTASDGPLACFDSGHEFDIGDITCIAESDGSRALARCDFTPATADQTSWTLLADSCPQARNATPIPFGRASPTIESRPVNWSGGSAGIQTFTPRTDAIAH